MTVDAQTAQSRRAILAGALGGLAAAVATILGRPGPASAAAGSNLIIGSQTNNAGTSDTQLLTNSSVIAFKLLQNGPGTALMGYATPTSGATRGVYGRSDSPSGDGVQARNLGAAGSGAALRAIGGNNPGVIAETAALNGTAILATNTAVGTSTTNGSGIRALSGGGDVNDIHPSGHWGDAAGEFAGFYGAIGASTGAGIGVVGLSPSFIGVLGEASPGGGVFGGDQGPVGVYGIVGDGYAGVSGAATSGYGVRGGSFNGVGVRGESTNGLAGQFQGPVEVSEGYIDVTEIALPASPAADTARLFVRDNGSKTELCVLFPTGAVQVIKTQA